MSTGQVKGKNARGRECEQEYRKTAREDVARRNPWLPSKRWEVQDADRERLIRLDLGTGRASRSV
jgi:hypothetical protein